MKIMQCCQVWCVIALFRFREGCELGPHTDSIYHGPLHTRLECRIFGQRAKADDATFHHVRVFKWQWTRFLTNCKKIRNGHTELKFFSTSKIQPSSTCERNFSSIHPLLISGLCMCSCVAPVHLLITRLCSEALSVIVCIIIILLCKVGNKLIRNVNKQKALHIHVSFILQWYALFSLISVELVVVVVQSFP